MGALIWTGIGSLDGYLNDASGGFDWAAPDAEVHAAVNDLERPIGTYLLGRRMYETMRFWETGSGDSDAERDYAAIWRAADKVVYSTTLDAVSTARTTLERDFDAGQVRRWKDESDAPLSVGGAALAAAAFRAGLVDEVRLFLVPVLVGGGTRMLPDGVRADLALLEERRFTNGTVLLRYRMRR
ncbi:MAG TPA: dihydrofolate reductase family protein [Pseudolysinimonas sp.]|nr:dihydrofolate reductase family protein [Pseudolysinimonas sp.]